MRIKAWSDVENGVYKAFIQISAYTGLEKSHAIDFGGFYVSMGGNFSGTVVDSNLASVVVNFAVEPFQVRIDPNSDEYSYVRPFNASAEIPNPAAAAYFYAKTISERFIAATAAWKALSETFNFTSDQTV